MHRGNEVIEKILMKIVIYLEDGVKSHIRKGKL